PGDATLILSRNSMPTRDDRDPNETKMRGTVDHDINEEEVDYQPKVVDKPMDMAHVKGLEVLQERKLITVECHLWDDN
ncbi:hypothetical protein HAX54_010020, partial [Datura stramonium]|nr:hypothetical protein [Datura stramonium]